MNAPLLLHVFATFGAGGPQLRAVQAIARLGGSCRHAVVAMDGCTTAASRLPAGIACELLPKPPRGRFLANVRAQAALLRRLQPALVLTYNWGAIETVAAWRRTRIGGLVHHEDGFLPDEAVRRRRRRNWLRRFLLRGVPVIVPSALLARIAAREWGLRAVHHLVNGVDLERFRPAGARAAAAVPTIGVVGGLRPEKDHANLLAAFARLSVPARLLIVGDGPLRAELQAQAQRLGVQERVEFTGPVLDPSPLYARMDVFALSSATEQMPLVLLEAMASGLPVVATDVGDVAGILPPGARAGIVPPRDSAALAQALDAVLADPDRRQREGRDNREHCERHFALGPCLDRFLAVYRAALGG